MTRYYPDLGSASDWVKQIISQAEHFPDLGSDASSVWNFSVRSSDVISRENFGGGLAKCRLLSQACHLFLQLLNSYKPVEVYWRIGIPKKVSNRVSKCTLLRIPYLKELIVIFLYKCRIYFFSLKIKFVMHAFDSWKLCKIIWKLLHIAYNLHHCCFWQEVNRNFNKNESPYTGLIYCESRTIFE